MQASAVVGNRTERSGTERSWGLSRWLGNVIGSFGFVLYTYRYKTPERWRRLRDHIRARKQATARAISWIGWWIRLLTKTLDILAAGEWYNFIGQVIKPTTRTLTAVEKGEAKKVFGDTIPYGRVRVDEYSLIAWTGALIRLAQTGNFQHLGIVIAYTINFSRPIHAQPGNEDMAWLIHELTHVAQMEQVGLQYYPEALYAQFSAGYDYGGPEALAECRYCDFNREQQADIMRDYYRRIYRGARVASYRRHVAELRQGVV